MARQKTNGQTAARKVLRLMKTLDEHEDVQKLHANFDIDSKILEKIQAG